VTWGYYIKDCSLKDVGFIIHFICEFHIHKCKMSCKVYFLYLNCMKDTVKTFIKLKIIYNLALELLNV